MVTSSTALYPYRMLPLAVLPGIKFLPAQYMPSRVQQLYAATLEVPGWICVCSSCTCLAGIRVNCDRRSDCGLGSSGGQRG